MLPTRPTHPTCLTRLRAEKRLWPLLAILAFAITTTAIGCHRKVVVTNTPAGVASATVQNWYTAVGAFKTAADATQQLTNTAIQLHQQCPGANCVWPDEQTYQKTLEVLGNMAQIEAQAAMYLEATPQNWGQPASAQIRGYTTQIAALINGALADGLAHVKNPQTAAALKLTANSIAAAITTAASLT